MSGWEIVGFIAVVIIAFPCACVMMVLVWAMFGGYQSDG